MMNEKAIEIGMTSTNFSNSSGINDPDNYSTVRDIAIMSKYLIKTILSFIQCMVKKLLLGIELEEIRLNKAIEIHFLYKKVGVDGVKTGYLAVEKYSLASSMQKEQEE